MGEINSLPGRHVAMISRYANDVYRLMAEMKRVLKPSGKAILVVGNSCLKGVFIRNSAAISCAATLVGLRLLEERERELPSASRYLPPPTTSDQPFGKRMRTETLLTFSHA
jgi:ubiquinone/menaquinone biosynthesis C-methylase UbiE